MRTLYLWPCNVEAWQAWQSVQTQWRDAGGGRTGLDYAGVRAWMHIQGHRPGKQRRLFAGIQAAERGTLRAWAERQD